MKRHIRLFVARQTRQTISRSETRLAKTLKTEFRRVVKAAAKAYPDWRGTMKTHKERLLSILVTELKRAGTEAHHQERERWLSKSATGKMERKLDTGEQADARIMKWAKQYAAKKVTQITDTTETRISNAIQRGLDANAAPSEIADLIQEEVGDMSDARAMMIARTESATAVNSAKQESMNDIADETGIVFIKIWTATQDDRTRESHSDADGQERAMDEPFDIGGTELMHPCDPYGPPEEVINCRCVEVYDAK
jgi:uncharacterized protein with gpF-like domain